MNNENPALREKSDCNINKELLRLKERLADVIEVDEQIAAIKSLKLIKTEMTKQLEIAEQFYVYRKKCLLTLECVIISVTNYLRTRRLLIEQYQEELQVLQARLLAANESNNEKLGREIATRREYVSLQVEKIAIEVNEIEETLSQYSKGCGELAASLPLISKGLQK